MDKPSSTDNIHKRILLLQIIGILLTGFLTSAISIFFLFTELRESKVESIKFSLRENALIINEHILKLNSITAQISSRTTLTRYLVKHNNNQIDNDKFVTSSTKFLQDAMNSSEKILGISHIDQKGKVVVHVGEKLDESKFPLNPVGSEVTYSGPYENDGEHYLVLKKAIIGENLVHVGYEVVHYNLNFLKDYIGQNKEVSILRHKNGDIINLFTGKPLDKKFCENIDKNNSKKNHVWNHEGFIYGVTQLTSQPWIVASTYDEAKFFENTDRILIILVPLLTFLIMLILIITNRILIPLSGKIILNSSELQEKVTAGQNKLKAQDRLASLGLLTAGVAHEIRNPINLINNSSIIIKDFIDSALKKNQDKPSQSFTAGDYKEYLSGLEQMQVMTDIISKNGNRTNRIIENMLSLSRNKKSNLEKTNVKNLIEDTVHLAQNSANVRYKFKLDPKLFLTEIPPVNLYKTELLRAMGNLFDNAFFSLKEKQTKLGKEFSPELKITLVLAKDQLFKIEIQDNGMGIAPDVVKNIFDPFFTTKDAGDGTGLGLSIVKDIIEMHGGTIDIQSEENQGVKFTILLPIFL